MPRPTARVLTMLELLQSAPKRSVGELAAVLEVDERTVRRYAEHLRELGVPVETVRGRYGGYRIGEGFAMPPLMLTDEEALAVMLALALGRRAGILPEKDRGLDSATAKVERALPTPLRKRFEGLVAMPFFDATAGGSAKGADAAS
ncbi:HTH domain-containing protein [Schumannella luteola]|uniref:Putative DNA-binding transcriptional regulator YafY n=1 Tax=Schumannella luteola TaxID=472059 RepID=A0A852YBH2_9MICO|nr:HTH domain-containing protein [Schumannella luteola]NYG98541.1 putative DNA-binding transcriptional regulator YafY [Schumannella luteola]TPX01238.1 HTH domain-containing protein [Schumannella luteola]